MDDEAVLELMAVVDLMSGFSKLMDGLRVEADKKSGMGEDKSRNAVSIHTTNAN